MSERESKVCAGCGKKIEGGHAYHVADTEDYLCPTSVCDSFKGGVGSFGRSCQFLYMVKYKRAIRTNLVSI